MIPFSLLLSSSLRSTGEELLGVLDATSFSEWSSSSSSLRDVAIERASHDMALVWRGWERGEG